MATSPRHVNTFTSGMVGDVADELQPRGTYRYGRNVKLLYNSGPADPDLADELKALNGRSLAIEFPRGTLPATSLPTGYRKLGKGVHTPLGRIVFSTNGVNGEIGRIQRKPWRYQTLYNDSRDPNGDKLDFHLGDRLQAKVVTENSKVCRVYFTDNVYGHGMRVLNLYLALNAAGVPVHESPAAYPKHLSVHAMAAQPAIKRAEVSFDGRIAGSLASGMYQTTYRYRSLDGHPSPWSALSLPVAVFDQSMPADAAASNHHRRYMGSAGVQTSEGLRFTFDGLDTRWHEVEIALIYHSAGFGAERARLVKVLPATTAKVTVDIANFGGQAIPMESFRTAYETILQVGTLATANNLMYQGRVMLQKPMVVDGADLKTEFISMNFLADETDEPTFKPTPNPANPSRQDGDKLTNSSRQTVELLTSRYKDKSGTTIFRKHKIVDDFVNNKGQLFQQLFKGYRRGESYGFGAVCRDDRGRAYFVQDLGEIIFPTLANYSTTTYDAKVGKWLLRSLGVRLSNIKIPADVAYYPDGKLRLSSVEIVRTAASGRIGFQAVVVPATTNVPFDGAREEDTLGLKVEPSVSFNNAFTLKYESGNAGVGHRGTHRSALQTGDKVADIRGAWAQTKAYWSQLHAPDLLISGKLPELTDATRLELIGAAHKSTRSNEIRLTMADPNARPDDSMMFYTKQYKVNAQTLDKGDSYGRPVVGSTTRIRTWFRHDNADVSKKYEKIDPDNPKIVYGAAQNWLTHISGDIVNNTTQPTYRPSQGGNHNRVDAILQPGTVIAKTTDWETTDVIESKSSYVSTNLVNFIKPADRIAPADEQIYIPTGTALTIDKALLDSLPTLTDNAGKTTHFLLNGVDVFGGDTYVNLFDFAQLYPYWEINGNRRFGWTTDYGIGRIVPIESVVNLAARSGRSLANNAFFPQIASFENQAPHTTGGIAWTQPEDWNIAGVMNPLETIDQYTQQPRATNYLDDRIYSIYASDQKTYGEREDSFRKQLPADFTDAEGTQGEIVRMEELFNGVYVFQQRDVARLRSRDRAAIPTDKGELVTGSGKNLDGLDYIGNGSGLQQFDAFEVYKKSVYWIDGINKQLVRFTQAGKDEMSEREKAHDVFRTLLPDDATQLPHCELSFNPIDKEVYVSWSSFDKLSGKPKPRGTLVYSEALDYMEGWLDLYPDKFFVFDDTLLVTNPAARHEIHECGVGDYCQYFGKYYDSVLTYVVNPEPDYPKKFDNLFMAINGGGRRTLKSLKMETETATQSLDLSPGADSAVQYRSGKLMLPLKEQAAPGQPAIARMWGTTMRLTLTMDPTRLPLTERLTLLGTHTFFRPIKKI